MKRTMRYDQFKIGNIPVIQLGEPSDNLYLFLHGQGGNKEEAAAFAEIACPSGWQVLGIDLPGHGERTDSDHFSPWDIVPELHKILDNVTPQYKRIALRATSIGAWFGMLAFADVPLVQCLFVSPILDMQQLIQNMMQWAGVSAEQLEKDQIIPTDFGQTLSWEYLTWVKEHLMTDWQHPTKILYAAQDNLTERYVVNDFIVKFGGELTVIKNGEHWFHTPEQLEIMEEWTRNALLKTI